MLVWWLTQRDCQRLGPTLPAEVPSRVAHTYAQRFGRNGRGRIWAAPELEPVQSNWRSESEICQEILRCSAGGIVLQSEDLDLLPEVGLVTDLNYQLVQRSPRVCAA